MTIDRPEEYLASIFDSSPVPLISLDMKLRIIMFNRTARELTGYSSPEITGCRVTKILSREKASRIINILRKRGKASIGGYLTKLTAADGTRIPVRLKISPLTDSENRLIGILLVASDLREIKQLQAKLLEAERIAAITETAISVNHEINNPLCSILGNTQLMLMEKENLDPEIVKKLCSIEEQIARIQVIAERLGRITKPVLKEYVGGKKMLDVEHSEIKSGN